VTRAHAFTGKIGLDLCGFLGSLKKTVDDLSKPNMNISVVIVNWNDKNDTLACLGSVYASTMRTVQVIVVDNGSTDGSIETIETQFPEVHLIGLAENVHFAAGANTGISHALEQAPDAVLLLNNDATLAPGTLEKLAATLEHTPGLGIVGAHLIHPDGREVIGAFCDFNTGMIGEPVPPDDGEPMLVDYVWGTAMLIRAQVLEQIGLFDEAYVAYFEDMDFCFRARAAGWEVAGVPGAIVHHAGSKSANRVFLQQMWLRGRNWVRCFMQHAPPENRSSLRWHLLIHRMPHLAWSTIRTIAARKLRPKGHPIKLWSRS
jgi:GT2 family glycosyltransferase